ncbi:MAG: hypothetical protein IKO41_21510 [Lachnospiraceae bacterium]|nr:hypothetical protein [Lachnospiraceae bacterium]
MKYLIPTYWFTPKYKQVYDQDEFDLELVRLTSMYNDFVKAHKVEIEDVNKQMILLSQDHAICFEVVDNLPKEFENHYNPWFKPKEITNIIDNGVPCILPSRVLRKGKPFILVIDDVKYDCLIPKIDKFMEPRKASDEEFERTGLLYDPRDEFLFYHDCWGGRVSLEINAAYYKTPNAPY